MNLEINNIKELIEAANTKNSTISSKINGEWVNEFSCVTFLVKDSGKIISSYNFTKNIHFGNVNNPHQSDLYGHIIFTHHKGDYKTEVFKIYKSKEKFDAAIKRFYNKHKDGDFTVFV